MRHYHLHTKKLHVHVHDDFEESDHPRGQPDNPGQFAKKGEATTPSNKSEHKLYDGPSASSTGLVKKGDAFVNKRIEELESSGDDNPDNHEYSALSHIGTVLDLMNKIPLSQKRLWRFAVTSPDGQKPTAAGSLKIDGKTAEVVNVGSIAKGAGSSVMESLLSQAKSAGVKNVKLQSTAKDFYEKLGFVLKSDGFMYKNIG